MAYFEFTTDLISVAFAFVSLKQTNVSKKTKTCQSNQYVQCKDGII